jgi:hypothetical protein
MMKKTRWLVLTLALALGLGLLAILLATPEVGLAQPAGMDAGRSNEGPPALAMTGRAPLLPMSMGSRTPPASPLGIGLMSISGSSVETEACYQENITQTLCFNVYNGSTDGEWLDGITLTLPAEPSPPPPAWNVSACGSQDSTDSTG